jgi:hypothetical protein
MLYEDQSGKIRENTEKSLRLAAMLFPDETWVYKEPNIYIAQSRLIEEHREKDKWKREMTQVRILTGRGSVAVFLPEKKKNEETGRCCVDLVLDGTILEMKTVSGTIKTLGWEFKKGFKQGKAMFEGYSDIPEHSVFIHILSQHLTVEAVKAKIAGELKGRPDDGHFICLFETTRQLYTWTYEELRSLIGKG